MLVQIHSRPDDTWIGMNALLHRASLNTKYGAEFGPCSSAAWKNLPASG
jgi:hypothetical protein